MTKSGRLSWKPSDSLMVWGWCAWLCGLQPPSCLCIRGAQCANHYLSFQLERYEQNAGVRRPQLKPVLLAKNCKRYRFAYLHPNIESSFNPESLHALSPRDEKNDMMAMNDTHCRGKTFWLQSWEVLQVSRSQAELKAVVELPGTKVPVACRVLLFVWTKAQDGEDAEESE